MWFFPIILTEIIHYNLLADGKDYTYTYETDTLDDRDSSECNSVPIISDNIVEEEECFVVSLSSTSTFAGLTLNPEIAIVCINDDDGELCIRIFVELSNLLLY